MKRTGNFALCVSVFSVILGFLVIGLASLTGVAASKAQGRNAIRIHVVESSEELHESLQDKPTLHFESSRLEGLTIIVDDAKKYQQIDGFGASLTDSSAWLISQKLTIAKRRELLKLLLTRKKESA